MIEYRAIAPPDYEAVRQILTEVGWELRVRDAARFAKMMERATRTVVAWEVSVVGEAAPEAVRVVGFGRALCDGVSNGYISMLAVAADKRGQGIGRELVRRLMEDDEDNEVTWVLRAGRESSGFWQVLGFAPSEIAMERKRSRS